MMLLKSLLQGFLDFSAFLESDRSCLVTRSLRSQLSQGHAEGPVSLLPVGCLFHDCFRGNPDKET